MRIGVWSLGALMLGLVAANVYLARTVWALAGEVAELRSQIDERPAPTRVVVPLQLPSPPVAGMAPDYDRLATEIATRLSRSRVDKPAEAVPGPSVQQLETLAASMMAPYLRRSDLTPASWSELGRRIAAVPEEQRDEIRRVVFGAITRHELVPPVGIRFADALFAAPTSA